MPLTWPFRRDATRDRAHALYVALVARARAPGFYGEAGVADSVEGRFELILLHAALLLRRLGRMGAPGQALGQVVFDVMFDDFDRNLREMGISDLAVGRRVKRMAGEFYGRAEAYDRALGAGEAALAAALRRNLLGGADAEATGPGGAADGAALRLARYVAGAAAALDALPDARLLAGEAAFGPAPGEPGP